MSDRAFWFFLLFPEFTFLLGLFIGWQSKKAFPTPRGEP